MQTMKNLTTAQEAYESMVTANGVLRATVASFVCPFPDCRAFSAHSWGRVMGVNSGGGYREIDKERIYVARCAACTQEVIFINGRLVQPAVSEAAPPADDMPDEIRADFEEARSILALSPRGAAALLRLAIQKLLPVLGAQPSDINKMIGELVSSGKIPPAIQQALDSVRVIGNEAVHPGELDLKDDIQTATTLFNLINFIVVKAITEPNEIAAIYAGLPAAKLVGIAQRDGGGSDRK